MESLDLESARRRREEAFLMLDKGISWAETLSLGAWARLTLPLLRPPPASPCHARPLEACGASFRVDSIAMESLDLESAGAHARSFFDVGQGHFMGGDFEPWRLGAWAAAHETIPKSCFGISVQIHKDAASWSGLERGGAHARSFLVTDSDTVHVYVSPYRF